MSVTEKRLRFACLAVALLGIYTVPAAAATPACGTVLAADTTLASDMNCSGQAIFFSGPLSKNVVLDCAGYSITTSSSDPIVVANFVSGITIRNCALTTTHDGGRGIVFTGVTKSRIIGNSITTTGDDSSALDIRGGSSSNQVSDNTIHTAGAAAHGIHIYAGSNGNVVSNNLLRADAAYAVNIQSAAKNAVIDNTLVSANGYLYQSRFSLQNGGISVDAAGNIYAIENNWGSSAGGGLGIGAATAFFRVDPDTGAALSVIPLLQGGEDVGFGFDALEILPNGRVLALRGCCADAYLFEIDPQSGEVSEIAIDLPPGMQGNLNGLAAVDNSKVLATTNQGSLIDIDLDAHVASLVGDQEIGWTGIAIHPTTRQVFTVSRGRYEFSNTAHLFEIDIGDGTVIGEIGDTGIPAISGLDFALDGTLYGNYNLQVIDINTGQATTVGDFGPDPLEPPARKNYLRNNLLQNEFGSVRFPGKIVLPPEDLIDLSADRVSITDNRVFIESAELPFLDEAAQIMLENLPGTYRNLLVDHQDDGAFEPCAAPQCQFVSFSDGPLVFDVKGFTTYSSAENTAPGLDFVAATVLAEIDALLVDPAVSKSARKKLQLARQAISKTLKLLRKGKVSNSFTEIARTIAHLKSIEVKLPTILTLIDMLIKASKSAAQAALDAAYAAEVRDADLIAMAEADLLEAENQLALENADKALKAYQSAWMNAGQAVLPNILGVYTGKYRNKVAGCKRDRDNGKYQFTIVLDIVAVDGADFTGSAVGTANLGGSIAEESITIAGRISADGSVSGTTAHTFPGTAGNGNFTGQLSAGKLTLLNKGRDTAGDTCKYTRKIKSTRNL